MPEENYVVIQAIVNESLRPIRVAPDSPIEMIADASIHLRNELLKDIAEFLALLRLDAFRFRIRKK